MPEEVTHSFRITNDTEHDNDAVDDKYKIFYYYYYYYYYYHHYFKINFDKYYFNLKIHH